jgi:nicotinamide mononucleotide adenylyltransferase
MARMTTADQIRAGERAATLKEALLELLRIRFDEVPADTVATANVGSLRDLRTWLDSVVTADTMDQVFEPTALCR